MRDYDNWKLDNGETIIKEQDKAGYCEVCEGAIAEYELYYRIGVNGDLVHEDCFDMDYAKAALDATLTGG